MLKKKKEFVKALCLSRDYCPEEAYRKVFGQLNRQKLSKLLEDPYVKRELRKDQLKTQSVMNITKEHILELLYQEATNMEEKGSTRIQALTLLGKHLGMFEPQTKQDSSTQVLLVNYSSPPQSLEPIEPPQSLEPKQSIEPEQSLPVEPEQSLEPIEPEQSIEQEPEQSIEIKSYV